MKALFLIAAVALQGCAMDPMQQQQFSENFTRGLGATYRPQPVYQNPGYSMPIHRQQTTTCRMVGQQMMCDTW